MSRLSLPCHIGGRYFLIALLVLGTSAAMPLRAQVFTVESEHIDRQYSQVTPTEVPLSSNKLTNKNRQELIRVLQAEQGFAMRPLPRGHHGLVLQANGPLEPAGQEYLDTISTQGMSVKPGDRIVLSNVKIEHDRILFDINGGPDHKHRFLRHVSIGANPSYTNPVVADEGQEPTGSRITLVFKNDLPAMTGTQVKALLAPLLDFGLKTPTQAYADTLPDVLRDAIKEHRVLVGMTIQMVISAKGEPTSKVREVEAKPPFEEWIYGEAPKDVEFIRVVGDRVTRVEVARVGETPIVRASDETGGSVPAPSRPTRTIKMGDTSADSATTGTVKAPPSLKKPGEQLPNEKKTGAGPMQPVQFPTDSDDKKPDTTPSDSDTTTPDPN